MPVSASGLRATPLPSRSQPIRTNAMDKGQLLRGEGARRSRAPDEYADDVITMYLQGLPRSTRWDASRTATPSPRSATTPRTTMGEPGEVLDPADRRAGVVGRRVR